MKISVAVLSGGPSGEHEVSRASGKAIRDHLDPGRYDVVEIVWGRDGTWPDGLAATIALLGTVDVVIPALHGPGGEDGTVQGLLELAGVRYVGSGVKAGAVGMDKDFTKRALAARGLTVADDLVLRPGDEVTDDHRDGLGLPVFVKPARAGSSLGVTRVDDWSDLPKAILTAREHDPKILVEAAVRGREIDVAVLELPDGRLKAGPPLEIHTGRDFFDHEAKYSDAATRFEIPARLDPSATALLQRTALDVFDALECRGLVRVDFFLTPGGHPVVNEVNTFPGFAPASQFPRIWAAAGLSYPALLDLLINTALGTPIPS
ncbi:D-alanine--D-alanine ligase family protein [Actinocorallia longicatena]|uniref:D-alanine--D-alanine ligase n=1 Tax=Actinocorallia longicatena TaxID=111803 RepID=A0ABP6QRN5_9ACTN